jgi:hypothetical protein
MDTHAFAGVDVRSDALGLAAHRPSSLIHSPRSSKIVRADEVSDVGHYRKASAAAERQSGQMTTTTHYAF